MKSVICEFGASPKVYCFDGAFPGSALLIDGVETSRPDCAAPWHASGDILISRENEFIGLSYPIYDNNDIAREMALSVVGNYVKYIDCKSDYAKSVYGESNEDFFEIRVTRDEPWGLVEALSSDGAWYLDASSRRLLAFCVIDIESLLSDNDIKLSILNEMVRGTPLGNTE